MSNKQILCMYISHTYNSIPDTETYEGSECSNQHSVPWMAGREIPLNELSGKPDCRLLWVKRVWRVPHSHECTC